MIKKLTVILVALSMLAMLYGCENPNASKVDKVGSYASGPAFVERIG